VVNNAGGASHFAMVAQTDDGTWHDTLALNLYSVFYATRRALAYLVPRGSGRIITISSIEGKHPDPGSPPTPPRRTRSSGSPAAWRKKSAPPESP
jgi:3-hydroxybutyrate dehydrogenase